MKTTILVFAMIEELQAFLAVTNTPIQLIDEQQEIVFNQNRIIVKVTGVTMLNTYKLFPLLMKEKPNEVIQVGTCAGLKNQKIGSVIHAKTFFNNDLDLTAFNRPRGWLWKDPLPTKAKPILVSGSRFLASKHEVEQVVKTYDADGFDMESFGFFVMCQNHHIPFSSIRGVSDNGETHANTTFLENLQLAATNAAEATMHYLKIKK
jgi:adenosylhomocysteine nucleosidase